MRAEAVRPTREPLRDDQRLVVVGASLAGLRAVSAARTAGFGGEIIVVGDEAHLPYDRPPLSKQFLADERSVPYFHHDEHYVSELHATFLLGTGAQALDAANQTISMGSDDLHYDALVLATGASPRVIPAFQGVPGVHTLRTVDDAEAIRRALDESRRISILGAGFIGAEIASAARKRGCQVTIIEASRYPLERALGKSMGRIISTMHARNGVDLRCGVTVTDLQGAPDALTGVVLSDGTSVATDLLLVSIGASPTTGWLRSSGIEMSTDGGIVCDENLETSIPHVFAAGDIAHWPNADTERTHRLEHWTSANEQGAVAGRNAVGRGSGAYSTVPYFWSDWYGNRIQFAGVAGDETPLVVWGSVDDEKFVALYRSGDRLIGALAVNEPSKIMKDRRRIAQRTSWDDALAHYRALSQRPAVVADR